jgi:hypothetical protein
VGGGGEGGGVLTPAMPSRGRTRKNPCVRVSFVTHLMGLNFFFFVVGHRSMENCS